MHGAASCQALLARGELGIGGCHKFSRARQSIHLSFRTDPKAFLSGLSEQFSPALTPLTCFIFTLCLPGFQLEANTQAWGGQPIQPHRQPTSELPKRFRKAPVHLGCAGWSGRHMPPAPTPPAGVPCRVTGIPSPAGWSWSGAHPAHQAWGG